MLILEKSFPLIFLVLVEHFVLNPTKQTLQHGWYLLEEQQTPLGMYKNY